MAYRRVRKQVTWTAAAAEERARAKQPHPLMAAAPLSPERASWSASLLPGALWAVDHPMGQFRGAPAHYYAQHEFPYLGVAAWDERTIIPTGTPAVYMGTLRVVEQGHRGAARSELRHVFLIAGGRWLVSDLNLLRPVTLPLNLLEDDAGMRDEAP